MRTLFNSTFIKEEELNEARIYHPIKLEYYKIIHEQKIEEESAKFGISIVKREYKKEGIKIENKQIKYVSNDEKRVEKILNALSENEVTPIAVEDVLKDISKKYRP